MNDRSEYIDEPRIAESDFWFDPYAIPQYDLLVKEGRITQAEADEYRTLREEAGLPMTFADLEPRPEPVLPAFEWVAKAGGPKISRMEPIDIGGFKWETRDYGNGDNSGRLQCYRASDKTSYRSIEVTLYHDNQAIRWEDTIEVGKGVYARHWGTADDFEAVLAIVASNPEQDAVLEIMGMRFYPNGQQGKDSFIAVDPDGQALAVRHFLLHEDAELNWIWERSLVPNTALFRIAMLFGQTAFRGEAKTLEQAIADSLTASDNLLLLAGELIGDDAFAAGVRAGKAELKAQVAAL